jgi:toxin-antitoxin system PIN domain toxin
MIIPDANLLLYAVVDAFAQHARARAWLDDIMNGDEIVALLPVAIFAFVRVATNRRVLDPPVALEEALHCVEQWLEQPHVHLLAPGPRHLEVAFGLLRTVGSAGDLTTDAQLAAAAIEHQAELHSNDSDFARFPQLRWVNPLT